MLLLTSWFMFLVHILANTLIVPSIGTVLQIVYRYNNKGKKKILMYYIKYSNKTWSASKASSFSFCMMYLLNKFKIVSSVFRYMDIWYYHESRQSHDKRWDLKMNEITIIRTYKTLLIIYMIKY